ncbi:hypothetical protein IAI18_20865 [Acetobacteraceae bacterium H6797]|nr:hypothetical protein [Acetobacteraceae bacterium H6797]
MPFIEFLAPPMDEAMRQDAAGIVTESLCSAFGAGPQTMTVYFLDVPASHYAHAGKIGSSESAQRVFVKVHAYRRDVSARREAARALTSPLAKLLALPEAAICIYFFDRALDEVAHAGHLASDKPA